MFVSLQSIFTVSADIPKPSYDDTLNLSNLLQHLMYSQFQAFARQHIFAKPIQNVLRVNKKFLEIYMRRK